MSVVQVPFSINKAVGLAIATDIAIASAPSHAEGQTGDAIAKLASKYDAIQGDLFSDDFVKRSNAVGIIRANPKILYSAIFRNIDVSLSSASCGDLLLERIKESVSIIKEYSSEMEKDDMIKLQNLSADMARKDDAASNQVCSAHKHRLGELSKLIETYSNPETKRQAELAEAQANAKIVEAKRIADEREAAVKKIRENEAKRQAELERSMKLIEAQRKAVISCNGKTVCDKAFALTQIFISEYADMRIQMANETIIETFGSSPGFKLSAKATKVPQAGSTSLIRLSLNCNPDSAIAIGMCDAKLHHVYSEFPKYVKNRLKN